MCSIYSHLHFCYPTRNYEGKSNSKGTQKHIYCKYTEMKLLLLFDVITTH